MHFAGSADAFDKLHRSSARKARFRMTRLCESDTTIPDENSNRFLLRIRFVFCL